LIRFKVQKDVLPVNSRKNVLLRFYVKNYDASCIDQTGRELKTRISEHKNNINESASQLFLNIEWVSVTNLTGRISKF